MEKMLLEGEERISVVTAESVRGLEPRGVTDLGQDRCQPPPVTAGGTQSRMGADVVVGDGGRRLLLFLFSQSAERPRNKAECEKTQSSNPFRERGK